MARVALVTGGTRGIGHAISIALKNNGYRVAASYAGNDTAARAFQVETGIPVYKFDVANYEATEKAVQQVGKDVGPIDVLVNNAGITRDVMFHKMTKQQWDEVIGTNLNGLFNVTRQVWEGMRARKFGRVINISSINGQKGQMGQVETGIPVYKFDVANYEATEKAVQQVSKDLGPVDVLVNNAGITRDVMFHKMTKQQWDEVIGTNLNGLFNVTRQVWEGMRARKFGRVINISSINGQKGQMGQVNYSASKAGDIGFTKALAQEGARAGITVNVICPGYIATEMVMAVPKDVLDKNIIPQIPVGRLGEPSEIARCVVFLASEDAGFITGATLTANGGQYLAA